MIVLIFFAIVVGLIFAISSKNNSSSNINFNEFDDLGKISKQEDEKRKEIEYETNVLNQVYREASQKYDGLSDEDAYKRTQEDLKIAKKQLHDFKMLDHVVVETENPKEAVPISLMRENGNNFEVELFKKWCRQIYGCIKIGNEEQINLVKNFISEDLFNRFEFQKKQFKNDGLAFITEDLMIDQCIIYDYSKGLNKEDIQVLISAKMKEYIINEDTNKVVKGSKNTYYNKKNLLTFTKHKQYEYEGLIHNCPNCGAEVSQTELGKCRYCNTLIFPIRYNWTLTKFESL